MVRRIALAALGISSIVRGSSYVGPRSPEFTPAQLAFLDQVIPLSWYAIGWMATGSIALVALVCRRLQPIGFGFAIGFNFLWALSYSAAWIWLHVPRAYVSAASYFVIAALALCVAAMAERQHPPDFPQGVTCRR
ncbi:hypothetical protein [Rhodococcus erythropolis]|nr:hypothetical protein [Rhodococcus erythropolis]